jgi:putative methionine-R-sulfoxide reductase with GAF domain
MPDDPIASDKGMRRLIRRLLHLSDHAPRPEDAPGPDAPDSASQGLADRSPLRLAYEIGRAFAEKSQLDELVPFAIARCREVLDAEGVAVLLYDHETDELYFPYVAAQDPAVLQIRFAADRGIAGAVLRSRKSLRVDDASTDPRFFAGVDQRTGQTTRALLCAPLISPAGVVGVIEAVNLRGTAVFTDDDLALLDGLAGSLAAAIHNAKESRHQVSGVGDRDEESRDLKPEPRTLKPDSVFRKEGEYWTIEFDGTVSRLKDAKGLHYIGYLLRHPGQEFHVRELVAAVSDTSVPPEGMEAAQAVGQGLSVSGLGDAGPVLDAKAKAEYKNRLDDLREELEEAEGFNDPGRASRAREEMEFITGQLTAAVGLGGRDRVGASDAERARLAVTKRIKAAMGKIRQANPALERHLAGAITTGYFCSYTPTADTSISWSF